MRQRNLTPAEPSILSWPLSDKTILWLAAQNKYILAEIPAAEVIQRVTEGKSISSIIRFCANEFNLLPEQAETFVQEIIQSLGEDQTSVDSKVNGLKNNCAIQSKQSTVFSKKYYLIYGVSFFVEFETEEAELLIHPKFEYLDVPIVHNPDHHFEVLKHKEEYSLWVDGVHSGTWGLTDIHFLAGKFSMQILQKTYKKEEDYWMAVFHAAGITNGESCLIFLGASGTGKSTLTAILLANGFDVLADDFLAIESESEFVCHFPAAISIKDKAVEMLGPMFPQLKLAQEITNTVTGKRFRYLPVLKASPLGVPCKALVFVKYEKDVGFRCEEISGEEAFEHLVPDSWISSTSENANRFINWFTRLPYFRMTYSDNEQMIKKVKEMLTNDL